MALPCVAIMPIATQVRDLLELELPEPDLSVYEPKPTPSAENPSHE
jgi:uncharacterized protein (UPF0254 family)